MKTLLNENLIGKASSPTHEAYALKNCIGMKLPSAAWLCGQVGRRRQGRRRHSGRHRMSEDKHDLDEEALML